MMMRSFILPGLLVMVAWCWLGSALAGAQGKATVIEGPAGEIEVAALFDNDWAWFIQEGDAREALTEGDPTARDPFVDGTEFRRGRIGFSGPLAPHFEFNLEYDFIDGDARPADVYLEANKLPLVGVVRIGHQYEPLNRLTGSSKHLLFLEKPLPNALSTGRNTGLRTLTSAFHKRATLSTGIFRDAGETGASATNESWNLAARVTAVPFYQDAGRTMAHLGAFYGHRKIGAGGEVRFRQRPESHLAPYLVDTGALDASGVNLFGFESAAILGPASLQAEYMGADLEDEGAGKVRFWGAYVTAAFIVNRGIKNAVLFDAAAVKEKFGVAPQNIPALKALAGDSSDNIPGAVGIGPKVAAEVLEKYGNLENALAAATRADDYCFGAGDRGKKIKRILLENKEQVLKFQRLTAMRADAPVGEVLDKCSFSGFAGAAAQALLDIGLAGIAKRLPREGAGRPQTLF